MNPYTLFVPLLLLALSISQAVNAGETKATQCFGCHGQNGNSNIPLNPNLAGQQADYLNKQLKAFRDGSRNNAIMQGMAKNLSDTDIKNLAEYFAQQKTKSAGGNADLAKTGKEKAGMCLGCHGNKAQGRGSFPRLAGQHADYLIKQLQNFKQGKRTGGPMPSMVKNLSEQDIKALAAYFASL